MNHRRGLPLLFLAVLLSWAGAGPASAAQPPRAGGGPSDRQSHRILDDGAGGPAGLEQLLKQKVDSADEQDQLMKAVQQLFSDPTQFERLKKQLSNLPAAQTQIEQLGSQPDRLQTLIQKPEMRSLLGRLAEKVQRDERPDQNDLQALNRELNPPQEEASKQAGPQGGGPMNGPGPPGGVPPTTSPPSAPPPGPAEGKSWFDDLARAFLDDLNAEDGSALARTIKAMTRQGGADGLPLPRGWDAAAWSGTLERVGSHMPDVRPLADEAGSFFRDLRTTLPGLGSSGSGAPPSAGGGSGGGGGSAPLWVLMLAVFALLAWKSRGWFRDPAGTGVMPALGPWPVAPERVRSREELVRAFEYLALLRLGWSARTRNHLEVANRLGVVGGGGGDERREAAGQLARLYERARYAPEDPSLSEADLAAARRDLALLAGVSPA